ncbi:metal ABC transporter permease [Auritidibacter ignavus]|uniref:metal ABC transporter permease n=1 Tax=Auritidibacter ignavus TaxID=678932 RepID=UPI0024B8F589|nr:metal ABC transporter permease [Auritidibacter ignavus]WHS28293.1 metal ABC transporter permease [Auritidibacter ignavus]
MEWLLDPFALGFQQRALIGGMLAAVMSAVVGVWLVLRGMSFFGDAFVHAVVPGIAASVIFGFSPYLGAGIAAVVMVTGMELVHRTTSLKEDTSIGLLFVGMLGLGVVMISTLESFAGSLTTILFGDALGVSRQDIIAQSVFLVVVVLMSLMLYRPLLALSFSPLKAKSLGMRPQLTHWLLLIMIAGAVIGSFQAVGTVLVFGLLVGPAATAALLTRSVPQMMLVSALIGVTSVATGLIISYHADTAASATMAMVPIVLFFVVLAIRDIVRRIRSRALRSEYGPEDPDAPEAEPALLAAQHPVANQTSTQPTMAHVKGPNA